MRIRAGELEIEREFLVDSLPDLTHLKRRKIMQGYIRPRDHGIPVRVRRKGRRYFQAVKSDGGLKKMEAETEISKKQFDSLWPQT